MPGICDVGFDAVLLVVQKVSIDVEQRVVRVSVDPHHDFPVLHGLVELEFVKHFLGVFVVLLRVLVVLGVYPVDADLESVILVVTEVHNSTSGLDNKSVVVDFFYFESGFVDFLAVVLKAIQARSIKRVFVVLWAVVDTLLSLPVVYTVLAL